MEGNLIPLKARPFAANNRIVVMGKSSSDFVFYIRITCERKESEDKTAPI